MRRRDIMQCNIDRRGRMLRTTMGVITDLVGAGLIAAAVLGALPAWALYAGIAALLGGAFMIFEGLNGWCVVRALGFKTPI
jgi:hypothetical protein